MKYKGFFIFKVAQIINNFCMGLLSMLFSWIMIHDYNLESQLGWFLTLSRFFPIVGLILIGLFGSYLAPKATLVTMGLVRVIFVLSLALLFGPEPYAMGIVIIGLSLIDRACGAFSTTVSAGLYDKENFHNALRIESFISSTVSIFAGGVTGLLISKFSYNHLIDAVAISLCISWFFYIIIKPKISQKKTVKQHYLVGLRAVIHNRFELWFAAFAAMANIVLVPTLLYIIPIIMIKVYGSSSVTVGAVDGLYAMGALIASSLLNRYLNKRFGVYLTSVSSLIFVGFGFLLIAIGNNIISVFIAMFIIGLGLTNALINISNIHVLATPDDVRPSSGAVNSIFSIITVPFSMFFITKMNELGYLQAVLIIFVLLYFSMALSLLFLKDFKKLAGFTNQELENKYVEMYPKAYVSYG